MQHATSQAILFQSGEQHNRKYHIFTYETELVKEKLFPIPQKFLLNVPVLMIQVALIRLAKISDVYIYSLLGSI